MFATQFYSKRQKAEGRRQKVEGRRQKAEGRKADTFSVGFRCDRVSYLCYLALVFRSFKNKKGYLYLSINMFLSVHII